jgi:hypothetical protein
MEHMSVKAIGLDFHAKHPALHQILTICILVVGLGLCFYPLNSLNFLHNTSLAWSSTWPGTIAYLLTAFLIWWERRSLILYHLDGFALGLFLLARPLESIYLFLIRDVDTGMGFPSLYSLVGCGTALILATLLWKENCLHLRPWRRLLIWVGLGISSGLIISLGLGWLYSYTLTPKDIYFHLSTERVFKQTFSVFIILLGHQVIIEEVMLRGFLWGFLKQIGWKDIIIWLFQSILAMTCGIVLINKEPVSFWLVIPLVTLTLGALAWRSRSVAASMLARAIMAGLIFWSACLFASVRF